MDILAEFGYSLNVASLELAQSRKDLDRLENLRERIEESLPFVSLTSEAARRELLIAPVLIDILHYTHARLSIEYLLKVSEQLKGSLDYYLRTDQNLLIVEAKNEDLTRGFTQLAVELIAIREWSDSDAPILTGAVSTGYIWQFAQLHRDSKQIVQDVDLYRVPADLEALLRILVKILKPEDEN